MSVVPDPVPTTVGRQARSGFLPIPFRRVLFMHDLAVVGSAGAAKPYEWQNQDDENQAEGGEGHSAEWETAAAYSTAKYAGDGG